MNKTEKRLLLKPVEARAYYIAEHDRKYIERVFTDDEGEQYYFHDGCGNTVELKAPGDGGTKVYYKKVEKEIQGIAVGCKDIVIKARLFLGERRNEDGNVLGSFIGKDPEEVVRAALVYYGNMKSHWVPLSDIVSCIMEGEQLSIDFDAGGQKEDLNKEKPYIIIEKRLKLNGVPALFEAISDDDIPF